MTHLHPKPAPKAHPKEESTPQQTGLGQGLSALPLLFVFMFMSQACAAMEGGDGGDANLPNRGIAPYERVERPGPEGMESFVLKPAPEEDLGFREPATIALPDGRLALYVEVDTGNTTTPNHIARALSENGFDFDPRQTVLQVSDGPSWMQDGIGSPSVIYEDNTWLMAFDFGEGSGIGLAWSFDGLSFVVDPEPLLEPQGPEEAAGIYSPSLVATSDGYELYYEAWADVDAPSTIQRAASGFDMLFEPRGRVLGAGLECTSAAGELEPCWDKDGVGAPEVRLATRTAHGTLRRLFYVGHEGSQEHIGFAASWDGVTWFRYTHNPVVSHTAHETSASNLFRDEQYFLYVAERHGSSVQGITLAINHDGAASETF